MSYTQTVKEELIYSKSDLNIYELLGFVYTRSSLKKGYLLFSSISIAIHLHNLLKVCKIDSNISKAGTKYKIVFGKVLTNIDLKRAPKRDILSFFKGIFLSSGYLADPNKRYSMDIYFEEKQYLDITLWLMNKMKYGAKATLHRGKYRLSLRSFDSVVNFLLDIGAIDSFFDYEDIKIIKEAKESNTRDINLTLANDERVAISSSRQIKAMERIKNRGIYKKLDDNLQEIIEVRLSNPEISLGELSEKIGIAKSSLKNKIKLIEELAKK